MVQQVSIPLDIAPGVFSEDTPRQVGNYYKDGDLIRFLNGLPQKLGGWSLQSNGTTDGAPYGVTSTELRATSLNGFPVSTIAGITPTFTVLDNAEVWLFGASLIGGFGARTILAGALGSFLATASAAVTATAGQAVFIDFGEQWAGAGAAILSGASAGSRTLTVGTPMTVFLLAGSLCVIPLQAGGEHRTTLRTTVLSGATTLELTAPLPSAALTVSPIIRMYSPETVFRPTAAQGVVLKFLAHSVAASTQLIFTTALPHSAVGKNIDIRQFQSTLADGNQTAVIDLDVDPPTSLTVDGTGAWPGGAILLVKKFQDQVIYKGVVRASHDWTDLETQGWMAVGTQCKLYVVSNATLYDITPIRESGSLTNPFTTTILSRNVTVADASHQQRVGNFVRFSGASAVGGITISGEYEITAVASPDSYTIQAAFPASSSAGPGGGTVAYEYDIDCGPANALNATGWGTGVYGAGPWGYGDELTGVFIPPRVWSLDNFGEDLLASPNGGGLYWWDRTQGPETRAVVVANAPAYIERMLVSPQARHVIAIGSDLGSATVPGDPDPLLIRWSSQEDLNDWISTTTNSAGDLRLDVGSRAISAVESRGDILINTDESLHALQYIGSPLFFTLRHLGQSVEIVGSNGAVDVNGILYFMSRDDFLMYDGVISVMDCPVNSSVFDDFNRDQAAIVYVGVNRTFTEVWFFFPSMGSTSCDRYAKYNYTDRVWDYGTLSRSAWADASSFYGQLPYAFDGGRIYTHEDNVDGTDGDGLAIPMTSYIETYDMEVDQGFTMFHISRMVPDFKRLDGSVDLLMKGRTYPQGPQKTKGPFAVTSSTRKVDLRMRSKQVAFRVTSDDTGDFWRMSLWRAEGVAHGKRGGQ